MIPHIDVLVSAISALVYVLAIRKTRWAFVVGFLNQGLWLVFMLGTHAYGLAYSITFFACVNVYGFWSWTKDPPARRVRAVPDEQA